MATSFLFQSVNICISALDRNLFYKNLQANHEKELVEKIADTVNDYTIVIFTLATNISCGIL